MNRILPLGVVFLVAALALASQTVVAQRQLSWDALEVSASLGDDGVLDVSEVQTMVFNGDWNGGERTFNLRPRQKLEFVGMERFDVATRQRVPLTEDGNLDGVDDYAFTDPRTLRWRSRLSWDPPFSAMRIVYAIHYRLSGILQKSDERYVLDHDFAFPDRVGPIQSFSLSLTFAPTWQPLSEVRPTYSAGPLPPGRSFVLTIPLRHTGTGTPSANDGRRPPEVVAAVQAIGGVLVLSVLALFVREHRLGRFVPVQADRVDGDWIRQHILSYPPEIVGTAWDQDVGKDEVTALISRMIAERKLASAVAQSGLFLDLKVDRSELQGYERTLVDALFFDQRTQTSTGALKAHYAKTGFNPAALISGELQERIKELVPKGGTVKVWPWPSLVLFLIGAGCLVKEAMVRGQAGPGPVVLGALSLLVAALTQIPGFIFRQHMEWGIGKLVSALVVPVLAAAGAIWFLWERVGSGALEWSIWMIGGMTALTAWTVYAAINGMKSRNHKEGVAFRKILAAGRGYFARELQKDQPALSDDWYPWVAGFGLTKEADEWTVRHPPTDRSTSNWPSTSRTTSSSGSATTSEPAWTGAGGGRSGGAGGGAAWSTAVGGMAAGVAAPSSSSSSGGGSSSGSSSSGSSGGGGGGGW